MQIYKRLIAIMVTPWFLTVPLEPCLAEVPGTLPFIPPATHHQHLDHLYSSGALSTNTSTNTTTGMHHHWFNVGTTSSSSNGGSNTGSTSVYHHHFNDIASVSNATNGAAYIHSGTMPSINLNLSSTVANVTAGHILQNQNVVINIAGVPTTVNANTLLTPAEKVAVYQVLGGHTQTITLDAQGSADGGVVVITPHLSQLLGSLTIPQGVTVIDLSKGGILNLTGNLVDDGSLYITASNPTLSTLTVDAVNINVQSGGLLSDILPAGGLDGFHNILSSVNLDLAAQGNVTNAGTITSSGTLGVTTGSGNITNSGLIVSTGGNINVEAGNPATNININGAGGTFEALNGNINAGDPSNNQTGNTTMTGGNYLSENLNINAGTTGTVNASVDQVTGTLNINAGSSNFTASTGTLNIGNENITGDPSFYNTAGNVVINGNLEFGGEDLAIVANGNITTSGHGGYIISTAGVAQTATTGSNGGNIVMIAGAQFSSTGSSSVTSGRGDTSSTLTITGVNSSGDGGYINLSGVSTISSVGHSGVATGGNGGNITMVAYGGTETGAGTITVPSSTTINANGGGAYVTGGSAGSVTIIAGAQGTSSTNAVNIGPVSAQGGYGRVFGYGTGGAVTLALATPSAPTFTLTDNGNGSVTGSATPPYATTGTLALQNTSMMTGTITTNGSLTLISGTGNVGTSGRPITTSAPTISLNSTGNIVVTDTSNVSISSNTNTLGSLSLKDTSTSGTGITVTTSGLTSSGAVTLTAGTSGIQVDSNVTVTAGTSAMLAMTSPNITVQSNATTQGGGVEIFTTNLTDAGTITATNSTWNCCIGGLANVLIQGLDNSGSYPLNITLTGTIGGGNTTDVNLNPGQYIGSGTATYGTGGYGQTGTAYLTGYGFGPVTINTSGSTSGNISSNNAIYINNANGSNPNAYTIGVWVNDISSPSGVISVGGNTTIVTASGDLTIGYIVGNGSSNPVSITANDGSISLPDATWASINVADTLSITASGNVQLTTNAAQTITAANGITVQADGDYSTVSGSSLSTTNTPVSITAGGDITSGSTISSGSLTIDGNTVALNGNVTATGTVNIAATTTTATISSTIIAINANIYAPGQTVNLTQSGSGAVDNDAVIGGPGVITANTLNITDTSTYTQITSLAGPNAVSVLNGYGANSNSTITFNDGTANLTLGSLTFFRSIDVTDSGSISTSNNTNLISYVPVALTLNSSGAINLTNTLIDNANYGPDGFSSVTLTGNNVVIGATLVTGNATISGPVTITALESSGSSITISTNVSLITSPTSMLTMSSPEVNVDSGATAQGGGIAIFTTTLNDSGSIIASGSPVCCIGGLSNVLIQGLPVNALKDSPLIINLTGSISGYDVNLNPGTYVGSNGTGGAGQTGTTYDSIYGFGPVTINGNGTTTGSITTANALYINNDNTPDYPNSNTYPIIMYLGSYTSSDTSGMITAGGTQNVVVGSGNVDLGYLLSTGNSNSVNITALNGSVILTPQSWAGINVAGTLSLTASSNVQLNTVSNSPAQLLEAAQGINISAGNTFTLDAVSGTSMSTVNNNISITAAALSINGSVNAGSAMVSLIPNGNQPVTVGGNSTSGFDVPQSALGNITAGTLVVGSSTDTGNMVTGGSINVSGTGAGAYNLVFNIGGNFNNNAGATTLGNQTLSVSGGTVTISNVISSSNSSSTAISITSTGGTAAGNGIAINAAISTPGTITLTTNQTGDGSSYVITESTTGKITAGDLALQFNGNGTSTAYLLNGNTYNAGTNSAVGTGTLVNAVQQLSAASPSGINNIYLQDGSTNISLGQFNNTNNLVILTTGSITFGPSFGGTFLGSLALTGSSFNLNNNLTVDGNLDLTATTTTGITVGTSVAVTANSITFDLSKGGTYSDNGTLTSTGSSGTFGPGGITIEDAFQLMLSGTATYNPGAGNALNFESTGAGGSILLVNGMNYTINNGSGVFILTPTLLGAAGGTATMTSVSSTPFYLSTGSSGGTFEIGVNGSHGSTTIDLNGAQVNINNPTYVPSPGGVQIDNGVTLSSNNGIIATVGTSFSNSFSNSGTVSGNWVEVDASNITNNGTITATGSSPTNVIGDYSGNIVFQSNDSHDAYDLNIALGSSSQLNAVDINFNPYNFGNVSVNDSFHLNGSINASNAVYIDNANGINSNTSTISIYIGNLSGEDNILSMGGNTTIESKSGTLNLYLVSANNGDTLTLSAQNIQQINGTNSGPDAAGTYILTATAGSIGTSNNPLLIAPNNTTGSALLVANAPQGNVYIESTNSNSINLGQFSLFSNLSNSAGNVYAVTSPGTLTVSNTVSAGSVSLSGTQLTFNAGVTATGAIDLTAGSAGMSQGLLGALTAPGGLTVNLPNGGTANLNGALFGNNVASLTGTGSGSINLNNGFNNIELLTFGGSAQNVTVTTGGNITTGTTATNVDALTLTGNNVILSEAITAASNVEITSTDPPGGLGIDINAALNAGTNSVSLTVNGHDGNGSNYVINEGAGGSITASTLNLTFNNARDTSTANLVGTNAVGLLNAQGSSHATNDVTLNNGTTNLALGSFSNIYNLDVTKAGNITTDVSFNNSVFGTISLTGTKVLLTESFTSNGAVNLTSTQTGAGTGIDIGATINAPGQVVTLTADGTDLSVRHESTDYVINETSSGTITAGTLTLNFNTSSGTATVNLANSNAVGTLNAQGAIGAPTALNNVTLNDGSTALTIGYLININNLDITSSGSLTFSTLFTVSGNADFTTGGSVTINSSATLTANTLTFDLLNGGTFTNNGNLVATSMSGGDTIVIDPPVAIILAGTGSFAPGSGTLEFAATGSITLASSLDYHVTNGAGVLLAAPLLLGSGSPTIQVTLPTTQFTLAPYNSNTLEIGVTSGTSTTINLTGSQVNLVPQGFFAQTLQIDNGVTLSATGDVNITANTINVGGTGSGASATIITTGNINVDPILSNVTFGLSAGGPSSGTLNLNGASNNISSLFGNINVDSNTTLSSINGITISVEPSSFFGATYELNNNGTISGNWVQINAGNVVDNGTITATGSNPFTGNSVIGDYSGNVVIQSNSAGNVLNITLGVNGSINGANVDLNPTGFGSVTVNSSGTLNGTINASNAVYVDNTNGPNTSMASVQIYVNSISHNILAVGGNITIYANTGNLNAYLIESNGADKQVVLEALNGNINVGVAGGYTTPGVTTVNGTVNVTASGDFTVEAGSTVTTGTNNAITVTADDIYLVSAAGFNTGSLNAGTGTITLLPYGNTENVIIGASEADRVPGDFNVTSQVLANITAGTLVVGRLTDTGNFKVLGPVNVSGTGAYNLTFYTGGNYANNSSVTLGTMNLTVDALGTAATGKNTSTSGNIDITAGGALTVSGRIKLDSGTLNLTGSTIAVDDKIKSMGLANLTSTSTSSGTGISIAAHITVTGSSSSLNLVADGHDNGSNYVIDEVSGGQVRATNLVITLNDSHSGQTSTADLNVSGGVNYVSNLSGFGGSGGVHDITLNDEASKLTIGTLSSINSLSVLDSPVYLGNTTIIGSTTIYNDGPIYINGLVTFSGGQNLDIISAGNIIAKSSTAEITTSSGNLLMIAGETMSGGVGGTTSATGGNINLSKSTEAYVINSSGLFGGGSVTLTALTNGTKGGIVNLGSNSINSSGELGSGGNISISATGSITTGNLIANGGTFFNGGSGGNITLTSSNGSISTGNIEAEGGNGAFFFIAFNGGAGGNVSLTALSSGATITAGSINVSGGNGADTFFGTGGNGGTGGTITLLTNAAGTTGSLTANGGTGGNSVLGTGGNGGAGGDITLTLSGTGAPIYSGPIPPANYIGLPGDVSFNLGSGNPAIIVNGDVTATGGNGGKGDTSALGGTGGNGGNIWFSAGSISLTGGFSVLPGSGGDPPSNGNITLIANSYPVFSSLNGIPDYFPTFVTTNGGTITIIVPGAGPFPIPTPIPTGLNLNQLLAYLDALSALLSRAQLTEDIGTRVATDYDLWLLPQYWPKTEPLQGEVEKLANNINGTLFAGLEFNRNELNVLASGGVEFGPGSNKDLFELLRGNVFFMPKHDIRVKTREGIAYIPKGAIAWIMETGADSAIYDCHDNIRTGRIKVEVNGKKLTLAPGTQVLLTKDPSSDFASLNPGYAIGYRNVVSTDVGNGVKVYVCSFSLPHIMSNIPVIHDLLKSEKPECIKVANALIKNAVILNDLTGPAGYQTNMFIASKQAPAPSTEPGVEPGTQRIQPNEQLVQPTPAPGPQATRPASPQAALPVPGPQAAAIPNHPL